jgi:hypothetical protein
MNDFTAHGCRQPLLSQPLFSLGFVPTTPSPPPPPPPCPAPRNI